MESLLVKIFGVVLTLSQVLTQPGDIKTKFDPARDREAVVEILRKGCGHIRQAFAIEDLNLDELIATAMDDRDAVSAKFRGVSFTDMHTAYRVICDQSKEALPFDVGELIEFQNLALADLPDHEVLGGLKLPGTTTILDRYGEKFAEVYEPANRRVSVPLASVSPLLKAAFIAAEDKRFYEHKGVDERGIIRAFIVNLAGDKNLQGGSTITQQVAKNLLVGTTNTYVRKMREMVIASRMEETLSKNRIFEIYLNAIYFGRGAWGVETAAKHYFGKSADALTLAESAMLAGLAKGPNLYNPDRNPDHARERLAYVLMRMKEDGAIDEAELERAMAAPPAVVAYQPHRRDQGYHYVDYVAQQARRLAGIKLLTEDSYVIRSTIDPELQKAAETALQNGLAAYERQSGRARFTEAELNIADRVREADARDNPAWLVALRAARPQLYDVHWPIAVVLPQAAGKKQPERLQSERVSAGLLDGRVVPLELPKSARGRLKAYDVVYVQVTEKPATAKIDGSARAELRVRPQVQGAALVLENKTGQILALAGGFSYPLSQLNRVTQAWRQPGSALKPVTYLAALAKGLQPNTLISDSPITLPPIGKAARRNQDSYWSPQNYDNRSRGSLSLRQALEASRNVPTAHLLAGGIADRPEVSLDKVCELAREAQLYRNCARYYPFILGAQPVRMLDLARFYATVANEGTVPDIHAIASISTDRERRYEHAKPAPMRIAAADAAAFYQLKSILQGVVLKGTAARMAHLAPYIAGKTGTTDDEIDAWFVGFSNDVTIAVWVGYDNAKEKRDLGSGRTGANVAIPIFEPIMQASWNIYPKTPLAPPGAEAMQKLVPEGQSKEARSKDTKQRRTQIVEYIRKDAKGKAIDARYAMLGKSKQFDVTARRQGGHDAFATDTGGVGWQGQWFNNGNQGRWGQRSVTDSGFGFGGQNTYDQHGAFRYKY